MAEFALLPPANDHGVAGIALWQKVQAEPGLD